MTIPVELAIMTPGIMVVIESIKKAGVPTKYLTFLSIILGVVAAIVLDVGGPLINDIIFGVLAGGSASGIYDAGEAVVNLKKPLDKPSE